MKIIIHPNEKGLIFKDSKFVGVFEPGVYRMHSFFGLIKVFQFPTTEKFVSIPNQEILTKDNIAFRLSFSYNYKILDPKLLSENYPLNSSVSMLLMLLEQSMSNIIKIAMRKRIANYTIFELNEKRESLLEGISAEANAIFSKQGISILNVDPVDITFPKNIQDIFSQLVESKIRAQVDLENARTQVATARALKNASELMKGDETIKFLQYMETITKIASNGKHTFVIGTDHGRLEK